MLHSVFCMQEIEDISQKEETTRPWVLGDVVSSFWQNIK